MIFLFRTLFTSDQKLEEAKKTIATYNAQGCPPVSASQAEKLWESKKSKISQFHLKNENSHRTRDNFRQI
jgi:hypothetical protein